MLKQLCEKWLPLINSEGHYEIQVVWLDGTTIQLRKLPKFDCMKEDFQYPTTFEIVDIQPHDCGMEWICGVYCGDNLIYRLEKIKRNHCCCICGRPINENGTDNCIEELHEIDPKEERDAFLREVGTTSEKYLERGPRLNSHNYYWAKLLEKK